MSEQSIRITSMSQVTLEDRQPKRAAPNPDRPKWGTFAGFAVWAFSLVSMMVVPTLVVIGWFVSERLRGRAIPRTLPQLEAWYQSPTYILIQAVSYILAQIVTLIICWAVVTRLGRHPFLPALGWQWPARSLRYKIALISGVSVAMIVITLLLQVILPNSNATMFDMLINSSEQARIVFAIMAVFSAPLVEEVVYRGVFFSAFRKRMGAPLAVIIVSAMFALAHFHLYWGAWGTITGVTLLSFTLTYLRARTKSIFPCVAIHTLYNIASVTFILLFYQTR